MDLITIITDHCRNLGIGLLIFSVNLMVQAVVTFNQTQAMTIKNQARLITMFRNIAYILFGVGCLFILDGILFVFKKLPVEGNWFVVGYTLFIVAGSLIAWSNKLKSTDYKEFGRRKKRTALTVLGVAIFLLCVYMALTLSVAMRWIS